MNDLAKRIEILVNDNALRPLRKEHSSIHSVKFADVLRSYEDVFQSDDKSSNREFLGNYQPYRRFFPSRKRSRKPLKLPRFNFHMAPMKRISPNMWKSLKAVMEYYEEAEIDIKPILELPLADTEAQEQFFNPLCQELEDFWPLYASLECLESIFDMDEIYLDLPCYNWNEEGVGGIIAFFEGPESVAGLLHGIYDDEDFSGSSLPQEDHSLIAEHGFNTLLKQYVDTENKDIRNFDLMALENHWEAIMKPHFKEYIDIFDKHEFFICSEMPLYIPIQSKRHIHFAQKFCEGFYDLSAQAPSHGFEWNEDQEAEIFIHNVCEVWRVEHGQERLYWTPDENDPQLTAQAA